MNDREVLLVKEKNAQKVKAVKGIDENGKLQTATPNQVNIGSFLKIDKGSDALDSFFTNFSQQYKNPSDFRFFKVPANIVEKTALVVGFSRQLSCFIERKVTRKSATAHSRTVVSKRDNKVPRNLPLLFLPMIFAKNLI